MAAFIYDYHVDSTYSVPYVVSHTTCDSTDVLVTNTYYVNGIAFTDVGPALDYANRLREHALRRPLLARRLPWKCYPPRCYVARCSDIRQRERNKVRFRKQKIRA